MLRLVGLEGFEGLLSQALIWGHGTAGGLGAGTFASAELLLLDEPFGSLDALTRERMNDELLRLQSVQQQTIVMVTHSISEAVFLADRVVVLSSRPGQVVAEIAD